MVSSKSSGSGSGSLSHSATPNSSELAVPATTTSFVKLRQPIKSDAVTKGVYYAEGFRLERLWAGPGHYCRDE